VRSKGAGVGVRIALRGAEAVKEGKVFIGEGDGSRR